MPDIVRTPFSRVFTIEDRAGPANVSSYQGRARALNPSLDFGTRTPVREPDPSRYGQFRVIDQTIGAPALPTMTLEAYYQIVISDLLRLGRKGCPFDVQVHMGKCQDPRDANGGWDKIGVFEGAQLNTWSTGDLGALDPGADAAVLETVALTGLDFYEILRLNFSELAGTQIVQEVIDVAICDSISCGVCGTPSNGCQTVFAIQSATSGSPGLPAELIATKDGGTTIVERNVSSLPANRNPKALACVGTRLAIVSQDDCSLNYATLVDILNSAETWTRNASGLVCPTGAPNDVFSLGSNFTWAVGQGGYVYFWSDITGTATVQDAGVATTQNLNHIHGFDTSNLLAVGASNAVIYTRNGSTWTSVTGPAVGVALNTCVMHGPNEWFIGTNGGKLFYTRDAGVTWTEKTFPGSGAGVVYDISFATPTVGYLAHATAAPAGRILRTIDGGNSWYVMPEGTGAITSNQKIEAIAACGYSPNIAYGGGLKSGTDGILVKAA